MKDKAALSITCLLPILLFTFHWADDIARGMATGRVSGLGGVLILVVWLYGTMVVGERRSGHVIMLLGSTFGLGVLVIANSRGVFFRVWTLLGLGVTSTFSMILSALGLWGLHRGQSR